jgi:Domain of unknown function (DUF6249)
MIEELIPVVAIVFTFGIPGAVLTVWITLNYHKRRRLMELNHAERMAAIERGMDLPPLPLELIDGGSTKKRRRTALLPGLIWFFIGFAFLVGALVDSEEDIPVFLGLIPLGIGLAYLIYYFVEGRKIEARWLEHDLATHPDPRIEGT